MLCTVPVHTCAVCKCCAVCKRWEQLTGDDTLWKRLDLGLTAVYAGAQSKSWKFHKQHSSFLHSSHIPLHQGVLGTVLWRGCSILQLARATVAEPIFVSPTSNQVKMQRHFMFSLFKSHFSMFIRWLFRWAGQEWTHPNCPTLTSPWQPSHLLVLPAFSLPVGSCRCSHWSYCCQQCWLGTGNDKGPCLISDSYVTFRS